MLPVSRRSTRRHTHGPLGQHGLETEEEDHVEGQQGHGHDYDDDDGLNRGRVAALVLALAQRTELRLPLEYVVHLALELRDDHLGALAATRKDNTI